jgi:hypothetical protein
LIDNVLDQTSQIQLPAKATVVSVPPRRHVWLQVRAALISVATTSAVFLTVMNAASNAPHTESMAKNDLKSLRTPMPASAPEPIADEASLAKLESQIHRDISVAQQSGLPLPATAPGSVPATVAISPSMPAKDFKTAEVAATPSDSDSLRDSPKRSTAAATAASKEAGELQLAESLEVDNTLNPQTNSSFVNELRNGTVYRFVPEVADPEIDVPVVDVIAAIDLDRAVTEFLVLLESVQIRPRSQNELSKTNDKGKRPDDEVVVVYVVGQAERLAATLEKLEQHRDLYAGWSKQLPLRIAGGDISRSKSEEVIPTPPGNQTQLAKNLDRTAKAEITEVDLALNALVERNSVQANGLEAGPNQYARGSANIRGRTTMLANAKSATEKGSPAEEKGAQDEQGYEVARAQLPPLQLPLNRNSDVGRESSRYNRQFAGAAFSPKSQARADGTNSSRAVRMLFVLHPQSEGGQISPAKPQ